MGLRAVLVFAALVVLFTTQAQTFNISVIDYDAIEINVDASDITITNGFLYVNDECSTKIFSNWALNAYNRLNITKTVLSIVCNQQRISGSGGMLPSLTLLLALQLFFGAVLPRRLLGLLLLLSAGALVHVQAVFIEVQTDQNSIIFNDFSDLYQPQRSFAEMIFISNNPTLNGSKMILAYDPDYDKKFSFYFPINSTTIEDADSWLVIKENLVNQTIMYPSGKCVQTPSEFYPLEGYASIVGHTTWPDAYCFLTFSTSLNTNVLCAKDQALVYFRNNEYALSWNRELTEADLPITDDQFCNSTGHLEISGCPDACTCCFNIVAAIRDSMPTLNCEELPGGGIPGNVCPSASMCQSDSSCADCCFSAGFCANKEGEDD